MGGKKNKKNLPAQGSSDPPGPGEKGGVPGHPSSSSSDGTGVSVETGRTPGWTTDLKKVFEEVEKWQSKTQRQKEEDVIQNIREVDRMDETLSLEFEDCMEWIEKECEGEECINDRFKQQLLLHSKRLRAVKETYRTLLEDQRVNEILTAELAVLMHAKLKEASHTTQGDVSERERKGLRRVEDRGTSPIRYNPMEGDWGEMRQEVEAWNTGKLQKEPVEKVFEEAMRAHKVSFYGLQDLSKRITKGMPEKRVVKKIDDYMEGINVIGDGVIEMARRLMDQTEDGFKVKKSIGLNANININKRDIGTDPITWTCTQDRGINTDTCIGKKKEIGLDPIIWVNTQEKGVNTDPYKEESKDATTTHAKRKECPCSQEWMNSVEQKLNKLLLAEANLRKEEKKKRMPPVPCSKAVSTGEEEGRRVLPVSYSKVVLNGSKEREVPTSTSSLSGKSDSGRCTKASTNDSRSRESGTESERGKERSWKYVTGRRRKGDGYDSESERKDTLSSSPDRMRETIEGKRTEGWTNGRNGKKIKEGKDDSEQRMVVFGDGLHRCFKCLCVGHTWRWCTAVVDRSARCYRCGDRRHVAAVCVADPSCPLCADVGRPSRHCLGGKGCIKTPLSGRWEKDRRSVDCRGSAS